MLLPRRLFFKGDIASSMSLADFGRRDKYALDDCRKLTVVDRDGNEVALEAGMSRLNEEQRHELPDSRFAFPEEEKEPLNDAAHVRNAIARFNQVKGVTDAERDAAWKRIQAAAKKFGVEMEERDWRELSHKGKR
jgi:hypothetical protein